MPINKRISAPELMEKLLACEKPEDFSGDLFKELWICVVAPFGKDGQNILFSGNGRGNTLLHWALINDREQELFERLDILKEGLSPEEKEDFVKLINKQDNEQSARNTPLLLAIKQRKFAAANHLMDLGANPSIKTTNFLNVTSTPLGILAILLGCQKEDQQEQQIVTLIEKIFDYGKLHIDNIDDLCTSVLAYTNRIPDGYNKGISYLEGIEANKIKSFTFIELLRTPDLLQDVQHREFTRPLYADSLWETMVQCLIYFGFVDRDNLQSYIKTRETPLMALASGINLENPPEEGSLIAKYQRLIERAEEFQALQKQQAPQEVRQSQWAEQPRNQKRTSSSYEEQIQNESRNSEKHGRCCVVQ